MATHELYIGGPASANVSRAMFPRPAFSNSAAPFTTMRAAAHKNAQLFALTRVLDFKNDTALANFVAQLEADGTPLAVGDKLGIIVIPARTLTLGYEYRVVNPVAGLTLGVNIRSGAYTLPDIVPSTVKSGAVSPAGGAWVTDGAVTLATAEYSTVPVLVELEIDAIGYEGMGDLRLEITPLVAEFNGGEF